MNLEEDVEVLCAHCGEPFVLCVTTGDPTCEMVEDCAVCCRPMTIRIDCRPGEILSVDVQPA